jgi:hypothetical protein
LIAVKDQQQGAGTMKSKRGAASLLVAGWVLSGCATTHTGDLLRMPVESAQDGDVGMTVLTTIAVPVMLPFMLLADLFEVTGVTEDDVKTAANVAVDYNVAKAQQRQEQAYAAQQAAAQAAGREQQHRLDEQEAKADAEYRAAKAQLDRDLAAAGRGSATTGSNAGGTGSTGGGDRSRIIAGNGRSAMDCVRIEQLAKGDSGLSGGGNVLANRCGGTVEITWCYPEDQGGCDWSGNTWTLSAGGSWPVSAEKEIRWAACHGANTVSFEKGSMGTRYFCNAPLK